MTLTTPNGVPYPELADTADVPRDIKALAQKLDNTVGARPLASTQVRDVGEQGQIRAGRQLTAADFTRMGLSAPLGLWNLGDLTDASGNARTLSNKGGVPFVPGITGAAIEAAQFVGSTGQALYIVDTGASDPFRIRTGSWGCWFRTAKRGVNQYALSKLPSTGVSTDLWFTMGVTTGNVLSCSVGASSGVGGSDIADDRWHFCVATADGTRIRVYVDGALEGSGAQAVLVAGGAAPLNVGAFGADGTTAAGGPHYGRVDEAFVTSDVLSPEQVLNLYCVRVANTLVDSGGASVAPTVARVAVRRRRRGGALTAANFPSPPTRLHTFAAGSLNDTGSGGVALTANPGTGAIVDVADADGSAGGAKSFSGAHNGLSATDAGLPAGTASRSYGLWFKTSGVGNVVLMGWGTSGTADARLVTVSSNGTIASTSGADQMNGVVIADGLWHQATVVEDNTAGDGVKRKMYVDGRLIVGSTVLTSLTLAGANRFRIGANPDGTLPFVGQVDDAFVYAGALTDVQVRALYNAGSQALAASPLDASQHIEAMESTGILAHFDNIEGVDLVDCSVVA